MLEGDEMLLDPLTRRSRNAVDELTRAILLSVFPIYGPDRDARAARLSRPEPWIDYKGLSAYALLTMLRSSVVLVYKFAVNLKVYCDRSVD